MGWLEHLVVAVGWLSFGVAIVGVRILLTTPVETLWLIC
jgi:hypothetical protein